MHGQHGGDQDLRVLQVLDNAGVEVQAVHFGGRQCGQRLDMLQVLAVVVLAGHAELDAARAEQVVGVRDDTVVDEVGQDDDQGAAVPVVRHPAAVVTLARQVGDGLERHLAKTEGARPVCVLVLTTSRQVGAYVWD